MAWLDPFARAMAWRNLKADRFSTIAAVLGVALGCATVNAVLTLDINTRIHEARVWTTNPDLPVEADTVQLHAVGADGQARVAEDAAEETHEDYQVMRGAIRLGSLTAFLVGALIVFFTFSVVVARRQRTAALLRALGATRKQVATTLIYEGAIVGLIGAGLGLVASVPLAYAAAWAGITTTGRASLSWLWFPWSTLVAVALIGGSVSLLGVIKPARRLWRLNVARALMPRFLAETRTRSGLMLLVLPTLALTWLLARPFFRELMPSLGFLAVEAGLIALAFVLAVVGVPALIERAGRIAEHLRRLWPRPMSAGGLLTLRRVAWQGAELAWAISGLMLVFALLLSLHLVTRSLKGEVETWATGAIEPFAFAYVEPWARGPLPPRLYAHLPDDLVVARFSGRTPWPNAVMAVDAAALVRLEEAAGRAQAAEVARLLGPGRALVSGMMARRMGLAAGDRLQMTVRGRARSFEVAAITDVTGYVPMVGPYRNSRTWVLIDAADFDLIAPLADPPGTALAWADPQAPPGQTSERWPALMAPMHRIKGLHAESGAQFRRGRVAETDRDFVIFDVILLMTTVLAAVGVANQMVLSIHGRRREIALYRVLGMTAAQVRRMCLAEGAFVGLAGGLLAAGLGVPLGWAAIQALGLISAFEVRLTCPPSYLVITVLGAMAVAVAAALYPARAAAVGRSAEAMHTE